MLAIIRYACICLKGGHRLHRYFTQKIHTTMVIVISILILTPAIIWPIIMLKGSTATGRPYHLQYAPTKSTVVAFQVIEGDQKSARSPIFIVLICFHVLQFLATIFVYVKILYTTYMSTTTAARRVVEEDTGVVGPRDNMKLVATKSESLDANAKLQPTQGCSVATTQNSSNPSSSIKKQLKKAQENGVKSNVETDDRQISARRKNINVAKMIGSELINETPINNPLYYDTDEGPKRNRYENERRLMTTNKTTPESKGEDKIDVCEEEVNQTIGSLRKKPSVPIFMVSTRDTQREGKGKLLTRKMSSNPVKYLNSAGQRVTMEPKKGDRIVSIPYTNVQLCISRSDIVCTIGLSCQLASLIFTFILTVFGFRISGKIVTINEFFAGYYCLEIALLINSVIDPIVCVIFSQKFRNALKDTICAAKIKPVSIK